MASRKQLKKNIDCIIGELVSECFIRYQYSPGIDKEKVLELINELLETDAEFVKRINHTEPGNAAKYYKTLYSDFNKNIDDIVRKIEGLKAK
ncbi:MAG: hypothetical protein J5732_06455 [Bacteroidaceae bacterium]|nr:hypothetical protein [Bacteroidaceae bacterium]